jgi:hypothetical protein
MQRRWLFLVVGILILSILDCGGGSPSNSPPPPLSQTVVLTFTDGTPAAAAVQTGTGSFMPASLTGNKLTVTLPSGTTKFSVAYVCPPIVLSTLTVNNEVIVQATTQDGAAFTASCPNLPTTGMASGSVDASAIAGATDVWIAGIGGFRTTVLGTNKSFSVGLPMGMNDVAAIAVDGSLNALAVKLIRGQSVPGTLNGGNTIVLGSGDVTPIQPITVSGLPAGFAAPKAFVNYHNASGTLIPLYNGPATQYRAMPAAATESGDFYLYDIGASDLTTGNSLVAVIQTTTSGGGPLTINLPQPWSFSGPMPAALPTFNFNYTGFNGLAGGYQQAALTWFTSSSNASGIGMIATNSYQSGATTLTIPNLTSIPGFLPPPVSGASVSWAAGISGGSGPSLAFSFGQQPANGSISLVQNKGTYVEP